MTCKYPNHPFPPCRYYTWVEDGQVYHRGGGGFDYCIYCNDEARTRLLKLLLIIFFSYVIVSYIRMFASFVSSQQQIPLPMPTPNEYIKN